MLFELLTLSAGLVGAVVSLCVSVVLVLSARMHGKYSLDSSEGVQKFHSAPTPRVGGLAIMAGFAAAWACSDGEQRSILGLIGLTGLPALIFGMAEDITGKVGVKWRLSATIFSGLIFALVSGYSITSIGTPWLDIGLQYAIIAIPFTAFAVGGVANSINIIDGFHGLSSGTLIIIFAAFAVVALRVYDPLLAGLALTMLLVVLGFFVVNFPLGKLFLGDAGAYFTGYMVAVLGVMLPARNAEVSPWVTLLILGYPVMETVFSMVRRRRSGHSTGAPDSRHLHHLVHLGWSRGLAAKMGHPTAGNALTSVIVWSLPALSLLSVLIGNYQSIQTLFLLGFGILAYLALYWILAWKVA